MTLNMIGNGDTSTCYANGTITAGDFVKAVANNDSVTSSGASSFAGNEIKVERADASGDEYAVIGIAAEAATTGDLITVYHAGNFIVRAGEAVAAGYRVKKADSTDYLEVEVVDASTDTYGTGGRPIGTALTSASTADAYIVMRLNI